MSDLTPTAERVYAAIRATIERGGMNCAAYYGDCFWADNLGLPTAAIRPIVTALVRRNLLHCWEHSPRVSGNRLYRYVLPENDAEVSRGA